MNRKRIGKNVDLLKDPFDSSLRRFAIPLAVSFLIHMLYAWVDMYYVSLLNTASMAAVGVGEQIYFFSFGIGVGFGVGSGIVIARRIGEGNKSKANYTAAQALIFMFVFANAIALILFFNIDNIIYLMQITGEVADLAKSYLSVIIFGLPFNFIIFQINAIVRSTGDSIFPMKMLILANLINAVISPLLIFGIGPFPEMGIFGAGLATALAQFCGALISFILVMRKKTVIEPDFAGYKPDWRIVKRIVWLGVPASLQLITVSVNRMVLSAMSNFFGVNVLTSYMIGLRVDLLVFMSIFAVGAAVEITTGQNLGAKKPQRIFGYHRSAVKQLSILMAVLGLLVFIGGEYLAAVFTDNPDIIEKTTVYLRINVFSYIFFAIGIVSVRVISGAGDYYRSLAIVAVILFGFQIPLAYFLSHNTILEYEGIWYGILFSQISFAAVAYYQMSRKKWMQVQV